MKDWSKTSDGSVDELTKAEIIAEIRDTISKDPALKGIEIDDGTD
jgi:hypothetical protein